MPMLLPLLLWSCLSGLQHSSAFVLPTTTTPRSFAVRQQQRQQVLLLGGDSDSIFRHHPYYGVSTTSTATRSSLLVLRASSNDDDKEDNNKDKKNDLSSIPEPILNILEWITDSFDKIKWLLLSFTAGAVLSVTALLVPLYDSVQTVTQPVALFETILSDLDQAYVEPVDTNKLFETGVSAMLRSLDPYSEFEG